MKRLILISTLATLACLFVSGQALSAGNQDTGMGTSDSNQATDMMGDGQHNGMMGDGQNNDFMGAGQHNGMIGDVKHNAMMGVNLNPEQIREAQRILNERGFKSGAADGLLGKHTKTAISNFQMSKKLVVTGKLDNPTLKALAPTTEQQEFFGLSSTNVEQKNKPMEILPEAVKVEPAKE